MKWVKASGEMVNTSLETIQDEQLRRRLRLALAVTAFTTTVGFGVVKWSQRGKYEVGNPPRVIEKPESIEVGVEEILGDDPNVFLDITTKDGKGIEVPFDAFEYGTDMCRKMIERAQSLMQDFAEKRVGGKVLDAHIKYIQEALHTGVAEDSDGEVQKALDDLVAVRQLGPLTSGEEDDID